MAIVERLVNWFKAQGRKGRMGKLIGEVGIDAFRTEVMDG
jgi:dissimilatory sulfite reductase (desulfoviridin) alpha/beta subunit